MKLLLIAPYFFEQHRWMISAYKAANYLSKKIDVVVLTTGRPSFELINSHLRIYRCRDWFLPDPINYSVVPGIFFRLRKIIKLERPDVFMINKHMFFTSLAAIHLRIFGYRPLVMVDTFPGINWRPRSGTVYWFMKIYAWTVGMLVLKSASQVILLHKGLVDVANKLKLPWTIIHNGVDFSSFKSADRQSIEAFPEKKSNNLFITYIGRLESVKGYDVLLEVAQKICKKRNYVHFIFVGYIGNKHSFVKLHSSEQIHFLGHRNDIPKILTQADIHVLPSLSEGLPNSLMEAMAAGVACVASSVGGVLSLIEDNKHGLLVRPDNAQELENAVLKLIDNSALRNYLGQNAKKRIELEFNWERIADDYLKLFNLYKLNEKNQS